MKDRKFDHIELADNAQVHKNKIDNRFNYEPMLNIHPNKRHSLQTTFLNKKLGAPLWISSMTGGSKRSKSINHNLAMAANKFKLGIGLGSCRSLLDSDSFIDDFNIRKILGDDLPLYANLGIVQVEELVISNKLFLLKEIVSKLSADGLIIHVNPLQEWFQQEGDRITRPPIETIKYVLDYVNFPIIVKEVGQGIGPKSLKALMQLPLAAIEFGAFGGTNFAKLELLRSEMSDTPLALVGHSASEMVEIINKLVVELGSKLSCNEYIVAGGIDSYLDGYYLTQKLVPNAIFGQAYKFLSYAANDYNLLTEMIARNLANLKMAQNYLEAK